MHLIASDARAVRRAASALLGRRSLLQVASAWFTGPACTRVPSIMDDQLSEDDAAIRLGPTSSIRATLTSTQPFTRFTISGVGAGADLKLPPTNIARVLLPPLGVTIVAEAKCFPRQARFIQGGNLAGGSDISFWFSHLDRSKPCAPEAESPSAQPPMGAATSNRLGWVITNSRYDNDWPQLGFVGADHDRMVATLRHAGYQVRTSAERSRSALAEDADSFRKALAVRTPEVAIVYMSGHGMALEGRNYFVPSDAPDSSGVGKNDLLSIDGIVEILHSVAISGGCAVVLVDACRSTSGKHAQPLTAEAAQSVIVNHSAGPGMTSFDSDRGMSAWTEQFAVVADNFRNAEILQIIGYANRYTKWQSEASMRVQDPVLYGVRPETSPSFAVRGAGPAAGVLPRLKL